MMQYISQNSSTVNKNLTEVSNNFNKRDNSSTYSVSKDTLATSGEINNMSEQKNREAGDFPVNSIPHKVQIMERYISNKTQVVNTYSSEISKEFNILNKSKDYTPFEKMKIAQEIAYDLIHENKIAAIKLLNFFILNVDNETGICFHRQDTIKEKTGMSIRQIQRGSKTLHDLKIVTKSKRVYKSSVYCLNIEYLILLYEEKHSCRPPNSIVTPSDGGTLSAVLNIKTSLNMKPEEIKKITKEKIVRNNQRRSLMQNPDREIEVNAFYPCRLAKTMLIKAAGHRYLERDKYIRSHEILLTKRGITHMKVHNFNHSFITFLNDTARRKAAIEKTGKTFYHICEREEFHLKYPIKLEPIQEVVLSETSKQTNLKDAFFAQQQRESHAFKEKVEQSWQGGYTEQQKLDMRKLGLEIN